MEEFYSLAKENGVYFLCEASVGGGIPIICSLIDSIKVNKVNHIYYGIIIKFIIKLFRIEFTFITKD